MIDRAMVLMPQQAPMVNLVTKVTLPKGKTQADIPAVTSVATVQTPTEGDEISFGDTFTISATSITPGIRVIKYRISKRAERFSQEQLVKLVSNEMSRAQAQNVDELLLAQITNFSTSNDVGTTNTDLTLATLRTAKRLLSGNPVVSSGVGVGGPAKTPINCVISPIAMEDFLTNLGLQGAVSSTNPWMPAGMSEEIIKMYGIPGGALLGGVGLFWDGYFTENGSGDTLGGMFSKEALFYVTSQDWTAKTFEESGWLGVILRADADYGAGVGPYTRWGSQITCDGA